MLFPLSHLLCMPASFLCHWRRCASRARRRACRAKAVHRQRASTTTDLSRVVLARHVAVIRAGQSLRSRTAVAFVAVRCSAIFIASSFASVDAALQGELSWSQRIAECARADAVDDATDRSVAIVAGKRACAAAELARTSW